MPPLAHRSFTTCHHAPIHLALLALVANLALLVPGLFQTALTITGNLEPDGIAQIAPDLLEAGMSDSAVASFKPLLNPLLARRLGDDAKLKRELLDKLTPELVASLRAKAPRIEVYRQSRSITGTVRHLYEVGSPLAATLILLFSVVVPFGKIALILWAYCQREPARQQRANQVLAAIKKWSMADVFAMALFITYLAATASQSPPGPGQEPPIVTFDATFGPGFYFFTAYCLLSIATHHVAVRLSRPGPGDKRQGMPATATHESA